MRLTAAGRKPPLTASTKDRYSLHKVGGLYPQATCGSSHLFNQCRVLLCGLVHLRHGLTHLSC